MEALCTRMNWAGPGVPQAANNVISSCPLLIVFTFLVGTQTHQLLILSLPVEPKWQQTSQVLGDMNKEGGKHKPWEKGQSSHHLGRAEGRFKVHVSFINSDFSFLLMSPLFRQWLEPAHSYSSLVSFISPAATEQGRHWKVTSSTQIRNPSLSLRRSQFSII